MQPAPHVGTINATPDANDIIAVKMGLRMTAGAPLRTSWTPGQKESTHRNHLQRPIPGSRNLLMETAGNSVNEIVPVPSHRAS